jgi:hypothetical protein
LRLGKGYFVRFPTVSSVATSGVPTDTSSYQINLSSGWNLIGHPFAGRPNPSDPAADIDITAPTRATYTYVSAAGVQRVNVALAQAIADNAMQGVVYSYTGSNAGSQYIQGTRLKPWLGYWIRAYVPVQMTLQYPGLGTRAVKAGAESGGRFKSITRAERETVVPRRIDSKGVTDWRLQIAVRQGDLVDSDNAIGVSPDANDAFDNQYDHEKPPMMTDAPTIYLGIKGKAADGRATTLTDSIAAPGSRTMQWQFTVQATGEGPATIYWPNVARLPRGMEPVLVDEATDKRVALRGGASSYTFTPNGRAEHRFRIEIAPAASMPLDILNLRNTSRDVAAAGNYRFSFTVTRAVDVNAEIQTLTGKSLRRFQSRAASGVESSVIWDGHDEVGQVLPPGPYVLVITARDERGIQVSRRVAVMKNR